MMSLEECNQRIEDLEKNLNGKDKVYIRGNLLKFVLGIALLFFGVFLILQVSATPYAHQPLIGPPVPGIPLSAWLIRFGAGTALAIGGIAVFSWLYCTKK